MSESPEKPRGPVEVEIRITDPRAEAARRSSPLWLASAVGAFSAALLTVAVSLVGLEFFPWYRTPTVKEDALINCAVPVKEAVATALVEFTLVQAGAMVVGFVVVTALAYVRLRKRSA